MEALSNQERSEDIQLASLSLTEIKNLLQSGEPEILYKLREFLALDQRKGAQNILRQYLKQQEKEQAEERRIRMLWERERALVKQGYQYVAGLDEVGRGPLAGPVVAACVILPLDCKLPGLNDSKKIKAADRDKLTELIKKHAVAWSIGLVDEGEIDRINILQATKQAMLKAIKDIHCQPDYLLIDALKLDTTIPQEGIIQGDSCSASIAAASIVAKTYRDSLMEAMDENYPQYGFSLHKGYGTALHYEALKQYGPCPIHRRSFLHND